MTTPVTDQFGQMLLALSRALALDFSPADIDAARAVALFESGERLQAGRAAGGQATIALLQHGEVVMAFCPESGWLGVFDYCALAFLETACPQKTTEAVVLECLPRLKHDCVAYAPAASQEAILPSQGPHWRALALRQSILGEGALVKAYQRVSEGTRLVPQSVLFERPGEAAQFLEGHAKRTPGRLTNLQSCFG